MKKIMFNDRYGLTQAVIEGRKTMTRRLIKGYPLLPDDCIDDAAVFSDGYVHIIANGGESLMKVKCCYNVGELVAVAQRYRDIYSECFPNDSSTWGEAEMSRLIGWSNKLFVMADMMPHRIRITDVRAERLQDISEEDCMKEGIYRDYGDTEFPPREFYDYDGNNSNGFDTLGAAFASLIDKVSGRGTWRSNPWVFVYEFELVR